MRHRKPFRCRGCGQVFAPRDYPAGGGTYCSLKCKRERKQRPAHANQSHKVSKRRAQLAERQLVEGRYVYFIAGGEFVKIGVAKDPHTRLKDIATTSPYPLTLLGFYPGTELDERVLHTRFRKGRAHREWFRKATPGLTAEIDRASRHMLSLLFQQSQRDEILRNAARAAGPLALVDDGWWNNEIQTASG